jgi:UDP-glucose 4-epimerase
MDGSSEGTFRARDCGDEGLVSEIIGDFAVDAIAHFAGSIVVPDSVVDPLGYYFNNTVNSRALIAAAVRNKVGRFIFSSTAAVYGDAKESPILEASPLTRSRPTEPRS